MAEKIPLYLKIAHRNAANGDICRAVVTIINTLRNNPQFLETQPEAIDFLAEILVPGFEEEIHRLATRYPSFSTKLYRALAAHGKTEFARQIELSFEAYCIERMKTFHADAELPANDLMLPQDYPGQPHQLPEYRQTATQSGFFRMNPPAAIQGISPRPIHTEKAYPDICESTENRAIPKQNNSTALPAEVWMPSIQAEIGQLAYERHEFTSRNTDTCTAEGVRRFDRIRTHHAQNKVQDYADTAADRIILDFDNSVRETPKASMFAASLTKFKSFAQEQAEWREMAKTEALRPLGVKQSPMEMVAETTFALSDTPSVEPYSVRHPLRLKLTPQNIITCVFVCILAMIAFITWQTAEPVLQKRAIEGISESWIAAADNGNTVPESTFESTRQFVDEAWMTAYRQFLDVWKFLYYEGVSVEYLDPDSESFLGQYSSTHAAYITQEIHRGHLQRAKLHFDKVDAGIWRAHPYFKLWAEAQISAAALDMRNAASKYEMLLRTPLAPFAMTELGIIALDDAQTDIQQRFIQQYETFDNTPKLAVCAYDILTKSGKGEIGAADVARFHTPYATYCTMARVFDAIDRQQQVSSQDIQYLESAQPLAKGDYYRIEALIQAELHERHPDRAVAFYHAFELPEGHPLRTRLLKAILSQSVRSGNWAALRALNEKIPQAVSYLTAARIVDEAIVSGTVQPSKSYAEYLFKYPSKTYFSGVQTQMDEALTEAENGDFKQAQALARSAMTAHPDFIEPLYLLAHLFSQMGQPREASAMLEQNMASGHGSAVDMVLANLFRARANMALNKGAFILSYLTFDDPVLESARCEIFWRKHQKSAENCLHALSQKPEMAKATWIMRHIDANGLPVGTATQWAKASSGAMSFPGYQLAFARKLLAESQITEALRAYSRAILMDTTTRTVETVDEMTHIYATKQRRYEGTKKLEDIILVAERDHWDPLVLGALHKAAAKLYQPEKGHSTAKQHLLRAMELIGEQPELLKSMVDYYEAKEKPEHAAMWRSRLRKALSQ